MSITKTMIIVSTVLAAGCFGLRVTGLNIIKSIRRSQVNFNWLSLFHEVRPFVLKTRTTIIKQLTSYLND
jgi:hypothetical protein